jgi:hypothetical protein
MKPVLTLILTLAVSGCVAIPGSRSVRDGETPDDVRARLGAPATERKLATGDTAWYYLTGPSGFFTYRVVFGSGGSVTSYSQRLTRENFMAVPRGATPAAVLDDLGPPMARMAFERTATEAWTYRWLDGTFEMLANAEFARGGNLRQIVFQRDPAFSDSVSP